MTVEPIIDASWHRLPDDTFSAGPSQHTPLDPSSNAPDDDSDGSEWSFTDEEELITLDLGTERIAKRALLGYSVGLDMDGETSAAPAPSSARTVRGSRGSGVDSTKTTESSRAKAGSSHHLGTGKQLSITGLETSTPLMKINDTLLRGKRLDLFGTEIVLVDELDPTRPREKQHRLQPVPPSTRHGRADARSSTTRKRIMFRPIYNPEARETSGGVGGEMYDKLRALAASNQGHVGLGTSASRAGLGKEDASRLASVATLMGPPVSLGREGEASSTPEKGVGRGKYKRKEVSEEEQMIRAAERKIRKAAKLHLKQQQQQQEQEQQEQQVAGGAASASVESTQPPCLEQQADDQDGSTEQDLRPPPFFDETES